MEVREIDKLRTRLAKLSEVNRRITESWDLDTVLQEVVEGAHSLTNARYGAVGVFDEGGHGRELIISGISLERHHLLRTLPTLDFSVQSLLESRDILNPTLAVAGDGRLTIRVQQRPDKKNQTDDEFNLILNSTGIGSFAQTGRADFHQTHHR